MMYVTHRPPPRVAARYGRAFLTRFFDKRRTASLTHVNIRRQRAR